MRENRETGQAGIRKSAAAKLPHELFLFNLLFNHILLFVVTISAPSLQFLVAIVPTVSAAIVGYTVWRARSAQGSGNWHVRCHWRLAAARSLAFSLIWLLAGGLFGVMLIISGGDPDPRHYALAGLTFFPVMLSVIALILMESEALQHARHGTLPRRVLENCPFRARSEAVGT